MDSCGQRWWSHDGAVAIRAVAIPSCICSTQPLQATTSCVVGCSTASFQLGEYIHIPFLAHYCAFADLFGRFPKELRRYILPQAVGHGTLNIDLIFSGLSSETGDYIARRCLPSFTFLKKVIGYVERVAYIMSIQGHRWANSSACCLMELSLSLEQLGLNSFGGCRDSRATESLSSIRKYIIQPTGFVTLAQSHPHTLLQLTIRDLLTNKCLVLRQNMWLVVQITD